MTTWRVGPTRSGGGSGRVGARLGRDTAQEERRGRRPGPGRRGGRGGPEGGGEEGVGCPGGEERPGRERGREGEGEKEREERETSGWAEREREGGRLWAKIGPKEKEDYF